MRIKKKTIIKKVMCLGFALLLLLNSQSAIVYGQSDAETGTEAEAEVNPLIENVFTDKSRYAPKETVSVNIVLANRTSEDLKGAVIEIQAMHLGQKSGKSMKQKVDIKAGERQKLLFGWSAPNEDYTGYLLEITACDRDGIVIDTDTVGVDVSSEWTKFPRYGYVYDYDKDTDTEEKIRLMNQFHINAIEFYDWQYLHHEPLAPSIEEGEDVYQDWAGRNISVNTLKGYLDNAHDANMVCMAYDMIYAGTDTFVKDEEGNPTEAAEWQIKFAPDNNRGKDYFMYSMGNSPNGNSHLYFMNPLNPDWQNYIFEKVNDIFEVLDFDGWHGDTVGDWGKMVTADGEPLGYDEDGDPIYLVSDTYTQFLNAAKKALGDKYLTFNPVGAQGIENVNVSDVDALYTEFWPWDCDRKGKSYDTYDALAGEIEYSFEDSMEKTEDGEGKSLVVKAYINYNKNKGYMNTPGVLLCDAAVYAAGGSRLELGNGDNILHMEYYPNDVVFMDDELKARMRNMMDFAVAYENILRDGQIKSEHLVDIDGYEISTKGESDKIWTYVKEDQDYDILHLINLVGTDNQWRDEVGTKEKPEFLENLEVKFYTDKDINSVMLASPDVYDGKSISLAFEKGEDENGKYVAFGVDSLEYWDMIYMSEEKAEESEALLPDEKYTKNCVDIEPMTQEEEAVFGKLEKAPEKGLTSIQIAGICVAVLALVVIAAIVIRKKKKRHCSIIGRQK